MKKSNLFKLLFSAIVITIAFSSCTTYKESMVKTTYPPIQQKIPNVRLHTKSDCQIMAVDREIVDKVIDNEINKNIISSEGLPNGTIEAVIEDYKVGGDQALLPFISGFSLFTLNFVGFPFAHIKIDMGVRFNVLDNNNRNIKTYYYKSTDKSLLGFYYGRDGGTILVDLTKKILEEFRKDIERDSELITEKINAAAAPQYPNNNYYQQPAIAQQPVQTTTVTIPTAITSDVDVNIPQTDRKASDTFVLIIANEHYTFVDNVDFAIHDGEIFKEYCVKTLGIPERQVWFYQDATGGIIAGGVDKMVQAMSLFEDSKAIVYYCGHGIPDEHTGDAYIVPTDGKGTNTATCYSLNKMYTTLAKSNAKSVTYFMDACFSGANKEGSMLVAARGVAREAKKETLTGNTVVFSAASGDETAMTFKEKGHGLFTYFLLKKLQETNGDVSYGDLDKYIKDNVKRESFLTNEKVQHPATNVSENSANIWKQMKLK